MMSFESKEFETKKQAVNNAIKICIECGSRAVQIDNYGIYCKDCNSTFRIKEKDNGT